MARGEAKLVPFDEPLKSNSNMLGVSKHGKPRNTGKPQKVLELPFHGAQLLSLAAC
jgi:hypothetical protein